ncbi:helix-turn-helix domain-containing protein [Exiguobacterium indicum]|uniref:Helix-turn-helix domain-containing protein n=1 Tax=Exiguobacterium indicum TaxID=296995 RepID=A0ABU8EE93_9BACL|nr:MULTISPECIES: helix-turn-helix domain-containing protein [unclassified Exiguobacterium]
MEIEAFGQHIKQLRVERNLTQTELARDVCSQAELSKIENGKIMPTIDIVQRLSQKLHTSTAHLFIDANETSLFHQFDRQLSDFSRRHRYDDMLDFIKQTPNDLPSSVQLLIRYFEWVAREGKKDIDYRTCISQLLYLSDQEQMEIEYPSIFLRIKMSVANYYYLNHQYQYARKIYEELLEYDYMTYDLIKLKSKIMYNYAQQLYFQSDFETGLKITEKGIQSSLERKDTSLLGHFFYQRGCFYEKLDYPRKDIQEAFTHAYTIFHALDNRNHAELVLNGKRDFLYFEL